MIRQTEKPRTDTGLDWQWARYKAREPTVLFADWINIPVRRLLSEARIEWVGRS